VCVLILFTLPAVFPVHLPPLLPLSLSHPSSLPRPHLPPPGSSGEGGNNYYVNKYACCNHIRATDPIRALIAGGWLWGWRLTVSVRLPLCSGETATNRRNESRLEPSCTLNNALWPGPAHLPAAQSVTVCVCVWYDDPWLWITFTIHQLITNYCLVVMLISLMMLRWDQHHRQSSVSLTLHPAPKPGSLSTFMGFSLVNLNILTS